MDRLTLRNDSEYNPTLQSGLMHSMDNVNHRSSINVTSRSRNNTEEWKKTTKDSWKTSNTKIESWKMSGKPRHAQLQHVQDDFKVRRQSAPVFNSPKPLPQEPSHEPFNLIYPGDSNGAPFHINTPIQRYAQSYSNNEINSPGPLNQIYPPDNNYCVQPQNQPSLIDYQQYPSQLYNDYPNTQPYNEHLPPQPYNEYPLAQSYNGYLPSQSYNDQPPLQPYNDYVPTPIYNPTIPDKSNYTSTQIDSPSSQHVETPVSASKVDDKPKKNKDAKPEKKIRQITVQSINIEHRVWIDVLPAETGISLAEKIHIIATFRTRKIVSITTASGRKIPLDNRPVFGSWMDMEKFEDGERWAVEWRENDRGVVDRFMSKIVQSKRKD